MSTTSVVENVVFDKLAKQAANVPPDVRAAYLAGLRGAIRKSLAGERGVRKRRIGDLSFPRRFLGPLGEPRGPADQGEMIRLAHAFETPEAIKRGIKPGFAKRFARVYLDLRAQHPAVAAATSWPKFMALMAEHEGKTLRRSQFENLEKRIAGQAGEDVALGHPQVLAHVDAKRQQMAELADDPQRLAQLGLASLDPTPRIYATFHAPPSKGPTEGRFKYIDFGVVFTGVPLGDPNASRQVMGIKGQVKLWLTEQLVRHIDLRGRQQVGQLNKDELRGVRGAWYMSEVRIPLEEIIDDPRLRTLLTVASQDFTDAQRATLAKDGIDVSHVVHEVAYQEFYAYAREAMKRMGITIVP